MNGHGHSFDRNSLFLSSTLTLTSDGFVGNISKLKEVSQVPCSEFKQVLSDVWLRTVHNGPFVGPEVPERTESISNNGSKIFEKSGSSALILFRIVCFDSEGSPAFDPTPRKVINQVFTDDTRPVFRCLCPCSELDDNRKN